jgi:ATPase family protein associated with various cellular activities (AAA)
MSQNDKQQFSGLTKRVFDFAELVLKNRMAKALDEGAARYPIFRELRFAARVELEVLLDAIALDPAWRAQRIHAEAMILDGEGLFVSAFGSRKADYCSCAFYLWAADVARVEEAKQRILAKAGSTRITEPMFSLDWNFLTADGELHNAYVEEMANDVLRDGAYPEIKAGVQSFIARYLDAPETVLVLQGPPGTGKTRLIRAILGEMSRRKGEPAQALYTADMKALASDGIFVKFITGRDEAFVVEDADHLLKPRADGNEHLHRFLTIADGVVRSQGRKIIFSTNLPNVGDLDDALIRPGRCFARIHVRTLTSVEGQALAAEMAAGDAEKLARASVAFAAGDGRKRSLAEIYQVLR